MLFIVRLLLRPVYIWFITYQYILDQNTPAKIDWTELKNDLKGFLGLKIMHLMPTRP